VSCGAGPGPFGHVYPPTRSTRRQAGQLPARRGLVISWGVAEVRRAEAGPPAAGQR
jgi:hypothetical protein